MLESIYGIGSEDARSGTADIKLYKGEFLNVEIAPNHIEFNSLMTILGDGVNVLLGGL